MDKRIYKYEVPAGKVPRINFPEGAQVLSAEFQNGVFVIWALVDTEKPTTDTREVLILATGQSANDRDLWEHEYVNTVGVSGFVFHVFVSKSKEEA